MTPLLEESRRHAPRAVSDYPPAHFVARLVVAAGALVMSAGSNAVAEQPGNADTRGENLRQRPERPAVDPYAALPRPRAPRHAPAEPVYRCLGNGYVPYSYPGIGTCPCGPPEAGCFHPWNYYHGGKSYKRSWLGKWLKAHLGHGSMLEGYPCHCTQPTVTRPYFERRDEKSEINGRGVRIEDRRSHR